MICKDTKSFSKIRLLAKIKDSVNHPKYKLCTMLTLLIIRKLKKDEKSPFWELNISPGIFKGHHMKRV